MDFVFPWNDNEPNNAGNTEHCTEIHADSDGMWNDNDCGKLNIALCNEASPVYIFQDNDDYERTPSMDIGTMDILDGTVVGFDFILNPWHPTNEWTSILSINGIINCMLHLIQ